jgi:hypothetical protein
MHCFAVLIRATLPAFATAPARPPKLALPTGASGGGKRSPYKRAQL